MNLLIVDDIPTNLKLLRLTLESEGYTAFEAADGIEALRVLERERIDAVISDILMPKMDGYQLCHEVRKHARLGNLPFIVYSSTYTTPADEKLTLAMGADRFIRKPAAAKVIGDAVRDVLQGKLRFQPPKLDALREAQVLKEYSERLVNKLEERNLQLARQNDELVRLQERYRDLLENTNDLTQILSPDGRLLHANRAWQKALGYREDELGQLTMSDIIHPAHREHCRTLFQQVVAGESPAPCEVHLVSKDGREIVVQANVKVQLADGVPVSVRCIFQDITRQREFGEERVHLASQLSHNLRTPLNGILGLADLLRSSDPSMPRAELLDMANTIYASALRLERVMHKLLDLEVLEAMAASVPPGTILKSSNTPDTRELLQACARNLSAEHQREPDLTLTLAGDSVGLSAYWLGRLVARPLDNAFRYSAAGSRVHLETRATPEAFIIVIRDQGRGITPEQLARCGHLQSFDSIKLDHPGLGAGLVVAKRIAELHGGSLTLDSAPGQGTTVTIQLPRHAA